MCVDWQTLKLYAGFSGRMPNLIKISEQVRESKNALDKILLICLRPSLSRME